MEQGVKYVSDVILVGVLILVIILIADMGLSFIRRVRKKT